MLLHHFQRKSCDVQVVIANEIDDCITLWRWIDISFDTLDSVEDRCVALIDVAIATCDVVDGFFALVAFAKDKCIDAKVGDRIVSHDDIWRDIVVDATSAFDKYPFSDMAFLMHQSHRR